MPMPVPAPLSTDRVPLGEGRFVQVGEALGKGAWASVYRGTLRSPEGIAAPVALKLFHPTSTDERGHLLDVARDVARRTACVRHPNVVATYELGFLGPRPFLVIELVEGASLDALVTRHAERAARLPLDLALFIALEVAEGLSGARVARDAEGAQLGLVHLGLTAREVLVSRHGEVKLADFGAAALAGFGSSVRSLDALARRVRWMAPEVARGELGDARSDVFSLGLLLRELLVGPRFAPGTSSSAAVGLARDGFVETHTFRPHLPEPLVHAMRRAIELEPAHRYPNATALLFDLRRIALALGVGDARFFLRRALEREWGDDVEAATAEHELVRPEQRSDREASRRRGP